MTSATSLPTSNLSTATTILHQSDKRHRRHKGTSELPSVSSEYDHNEMRPHSSVGRSHASSMSSQGPGSSIVSSAISTSQTRARLRLVEREVEELRRAVKKERALNDRLKHEASSSALSAIEARLHVLKLEREIHASSAEPSPRPAEGLFKKVCSTDLLFLIDTTSSMYPYIDAAKEQVKCIVDDISKAFFDEAEVRIAVVGYKDHSDKNSIEYLDFTRSISQVHTFLAGLTATGGADIPEDVLGGIRQALNATWKNRTRCIIHIADAPPHGRTLHDLADHQDDYPEPGSEPHHLTHGPLLKQMIDLKINYALLRIKDHTDLMAFTFLKAFSQASAGCKLHEANRYYSQACSMSMACRGGSSNSGSSNNRINSGLLFEEAELGTSYSALRHLVVKNVTASISRTAIRMSASEWKTDRKKGFDLKAIEEVEDNTDDSQLEHVPPQWNTPGWLDEKVMMEGFSPVVVVHDADTLNNIMTRDDNVKTSFTELTINKRSRPFAQGALRRAFYARTAASTKHFVVKSFKRDGKKLRHLAEDMRCQSLCKAFALEFNALVGKKHSLDFIVTLCLKGKSGITSSDQCMSLEPFLEGDYVKYNTNWGYVNENMSDDPFNQAAQAFSHFTFERSRGQLLVCDLQGVGGMLTDPAVHALDPERFKLADTNLGKEGFKFFFASHKCNDICKDLRLQSKGSMIASGEYGFREDWPSMNYTVCCSNKLCGKIVHLPSAHESGKYPGYRWCDECWLQLDAFTVKWICVAPGPTHEFQVSKFFYESQGQPVPRKCTEHREGDAASPKTTIMDDAQVSSFFNQSEKRTGPRKDRLRHYRAPPARGSATTTESSVSRSPRQPVRHNSPPVHREDRHEGPLVPASRESSDYSVSVASRALVPYHPPSYTPPSNPSYSDSTPASPNLSNSTAPNPPSYLNTPYAPQRAPTGYSERVRPVVESSPVDVKFWSRVKTASKKKSMRLFSAVSLG